MFDWVYFPDDGPAFRRNELVRPLSRKRFARHTWGTPCFGDRIIGATCAEHMKTGKPICLTPRSDSVFRSPRMRKVFGLRNCSISFLIVRKKLRRPVEYWPGQSRAFPWARQIAGFDRKTGTGAIFSVTSAGTDITRDQGQRKRSPGLLQSAKISLYLFAHQGVPRIVRRSKTATARFFEAIAHKKGHQRKPVMAICVSRNFGIYSSIRHEL